jgi:hypothetical protein
MEGTEKKLSGEELSSGLEFALPRDGARVWRFAPASP